jgi:hypothetical protein
MGLLVEKLALGHVLAGFDTVGLVGVCQRF